MDALSIEAFYGQSIGVKAPWKVARVAIKGELKQVHILVECPHGIAWVDPETGERAEIKDWQQRVWRHLDTCEFETIITAEVPRIKLKGKVARPLARPRPLATDLPVYLLPIGVLLSSAQVVWTIKALLMVGIYALGTLGPFFFEWLFKSKSLT